MNGLIDMMGGGGPMVSGTWINQRTGEKVTVRDSYMDGEHMYVVLTDGRSLDMADFQNYVQMSDDIYDEKGNKVGKADTVQQNTQKIKKPSQDESLIFAGMGESSPVTQKSSIVSQLENFENTELGINTDNPVNAGNDFSKASEGKKAVLKVLNKVGQPKFNISVEWPDFPLNEIKMCKSYFETTDNDIAEAIIEMYCNEFTLQAAIVEWLSKTMPKD